MSQRSDVRRVVKAINAIGGASEGHVAMAATLLAVNGLDSAMAFVEKIPTLRTPPPPNTEDTCRARTTLPAS